MYKTFSPTTKTCIQKLFTHLSSKFLYFKIYMIDTLNIIIIID